MNNTLYIPFTFPQNYQDSTLNLYVKVILFLQNVTMMTHHQDPKDFWLKLNFFYPFSMQSEPNCLALLAICLVLGEQLPISFLFVIFKITCRRLIAILTRH